MRIYKSFIRLLSLLIVITLFFPTIAALSESDDGEESYEQPLEVPAVDID